MKSGANAYAALAEAVRRFFRLHALYIKAYKRNIPLIKAVGLQPYITISGQSVIAHLHQPMLARINVRPVL